MKKEIIALTSTLLLAACGNGEQNVAVTKTCALDAPAANSRISVGKEFNVSGWAFDKLNAGSQTKVRVQFNSSEQSKTKTFDAPLNIKRPDIATAFKDQKLKNTGFNVLIPANSLASGKYEIKILQDRSNEIVTCGDGYFVVME